MRNLNRDTCWHTLQAKFIRIYPFNNCLLLIKSLLFGGPNKAYQIIMDQKKAITLLRGFCVKIKLQLSWKILALEKQAFFCKSAGKYPFNLNIFEADICLAMMCKPLKIPCRLITGALKNILMYK